MKKLIAMLLALAMVLGLMHRTQTGNLFHV